MHQILDLFLFLLPLSFEAVAEGDVKGNPEVETEMETNCKALDRRDIKSSFYVTKICSERQNARREFQKSEHAYVRHCTMSWPGGFWLWVFFY